MRAGEKIPVDGVVTDVFRAMKDDEAFVDESMITGEPTPVMKKIGDKVLAGTIGNQGTFRFKAQEVGRRQCFTQIIKMVEEAQGSQSPAAGGRQNRPWCLCQRCSCCRSSLFCCGISSVAPRCCRKRCCRQCRCWSSPGPCALGLATPTALMVGIGKGRTKTFWSKTPRRWRTSEI